MTTFWRCDKCAAELEAHRPERHDWQLVWDDARGCMGHACPTCAGHEPKKKRRAR